MKLNELIFKGLPSYCTASIPVIRSLLKRAGETGQPILLEATANQINQFGGYTGMLPGDYRDMVYRTAQEVGCPRNLIVLGGDHLGPLVWDHLPEKEAMANAVVLVRMFAAAGYSKIHLDTSMRLGDDDPEKPLEDEVIARRGAMLYAAAMEGYEEARKETPGLPVPVFIIGSEVPIPGGTQCREDTIAVTGMDALRATLAAYRKAFADAGFPDGMKNVVAVVVQPGVEFGNDEVHVYNREAAAALAAGMKEFQGQVVLEGHSTDYQPRDSLRQMVSDGVKILKVGPALTFAYRDALFALSELEKVLIPAALRANFPQVLEETMCSAPANWQKHYKGDPEQLLIMRKYSLSDRSRYYFANQAVADAEEKLYANLENVHIPLGLLHQFMPRQFAAVVAGKLECTPRQLVRFAVNAVAEDYEYAVTE